MDFLCGVHGGAHTQVYTLVQMRAHSQHISHTGIVWGQDLQRKRSRERGGGCGGTGWRGLFSSFWRQQ